jgi:Fe-S-cluster-containing dehydrogenase component
MVIDLDDCLGCQACVAACKAQYDLPPAYTGHLEGDTPQWSSVYTMGPVGEFPDLSLYYLPVLCNQCEQPRCLESCPVGAITQRRDGIVLIDPETCTGCRRCYWACPYGAIFSPPGKHSASKCTFCHERLDQGEDPLCVSACLAQCRIAGDLNDPASAVNQCLAMNGKRRWSIPVPPHISCGPRVLYLRSGGNRDVHC